MGELSQKSWSMVLHSKQSRNLSTWAKPEVMARTAPDLSAIARLKLMWADKGLKLVMKVKFMHSIIFSIFLYAFETWTLNADVECRINAMGIHCNRKILNISYQDHVPNEEACCIISEAICPHDDLLAIIKKHKLRWYGHMTRSSGLAKTIMQGTINSRIYRGRPRRTTCENRQDSTLPRQCGWHVVDKSLAPQWHPHAKG